MPVAGLDLGSTTIKVVILAGREILASTVRETGANSRQGAEQLLAEILDSLGMKREDLQAVVATGYGRISVPFASRRVTEITCHGAGARYLYPEARTIIDIGGQDSKVIRLDANGLVADFAMNDKCAAGTGRFLEVMAHRLETTVSELGEMAARSRRKANISSTCTVFAESEVVGLIARGVPREEIAGGLCEAVAHRIAGLVNRIGLEEEVTLTGGVAFNAGVRKALEQCLGTPLHVSPLAQLAGAIGAALIAQAMTVPERPSHSSPFVKP